MTDFPSSPESEHFGNLLRDEAKRLRALAEQFDPRGAAQSSQEAREKEITRLATIAECAALCDGLRRKDYSGENDDWIAGTSDCAAAIRALSDTSTGGNSE